VDVLSWRGMMAALLVVIACGTPMAVADDSEVANDDEAEAGLRERAQEYLEAVRLRDHATLYHMQSAYKRGELTPAKANRVIPNNELVDYSIDSVTVKEGEGSVAVSVRYRVPPMEIALEDTLSIGWVLLDGEWYLNTNPKVLED
jgi:hypothetical protein